MGIAEAQSGAAEGSVDLNRHQPYRHVIFLSGAPESGAQDVCRSRAASS